MEALAARAALVQLNPIISAQAVRSPITRDNDTGITVRYLRFADAVDAVGWDELIRLGEVKRLIKAMEEL